MTKLILIGGFLGSGKTTLLAEAAKNLTAEGKSVGLVTNDQAPGLVDTRLLGGVGKGVSEVSGSCFCCNFNGFVDAINSLIEQGAETIIAEPVGSCTDLSATIMNPIKKFHPEWELAPLTVLVDPTRFLEALSITPSKVDPDALYIMKLQMEEADRILVNKVDTLSVSNREQIEKLLAENFPQKMTDLISARTGEGVDVWLKEIQTGKDAGTKIVEVDYDRYAHGEAVLGWLNATAVVQAKNGNVDAVDIVKSIMTTLQTELRNVGAEVGHVKAILNLNGKEYVANLTQLDGEVEIRDVASESAESFFIFNARAQMSPESLEKIVRELLCTVALEKLDVKIETLRCLMPGRPNPTHRFSETI
jgi:Putative GTPases (G3E family)